jgi:diaminopimelate decarboxylase
MGFNYNGKTRIQEVMIGADGVLKLIRRAETSNDLSSTLTFDQKSVKIL